MSWLFGSIKKKEPPPVTVDPTPVDDFYLVNNVVQTQPSPYPLYPNFNGAQQLNPPRLPYNLRPDLTSGGSTSNNNTFTSTQPVTTEPSNQLESIPFRISAELQANASIINSENGSPLSEFSRSLNKAKEFLNSTEYNYDFELERRILREAKMVNEYVAF